MILEIDKTLPRATLAGLLGEHRWSEVLKEPRDEEKDRVSKVYFCIYGTQRAAQKDGTYGSLLLVRCMLTSGTARRVEEDSRRA